MTVYFVFIQSFQVNTQVVPAINAQLLQLIQNILDTMSLKKCTN